MSINKNMTIEHNRSKNGAFFCISILLVVRRIKYSRPTHSIVFLSNALFIRVLVKKSRLMHEYILLICSNISCFCSGIFPSTNGENLHVIVWILFKIICCIIIWSRMLFNLDRRIWFGGNFGAKISNYTNINYIWNLT